MVAPLGAQLAQRLPEARIGEAGGAGSQPRLKQDVNDEVAEVGAQTLRLQRRRQEAVGDAEEVAEESVPGVSREPCRGSHDDRVRNLQHLAAEREVHFETGLVAIGGTARNKQLAKVAKHHLGIVIGTLQDWRGNGTPWGVERSQPHLVDLDAGSDERVLTQRERQAVVDNLHRPLDLLGRCQHGNASPLSLPSASGGGEER